VLPKQSVEYRGKQLFEFDLDAALNRNPGLILIDEMAHTNVPGLRHDKRWQDIKEIIDRGIDVYTTLNVQHLESVTDLVSEVIAARIKEIVPDSMLELADTVEIVDLPPEELLKRLQEGKVYFPEQAEIAKEKFFRKGNLISLRELALRVTAQRVGKQAFLYRQDLGIKHIWPIKEKILACVGPGTYSAKVIREAARIARNSQAEWIAVYMDQPGVRSSPVRKKAIQNLRLAERLGAQTRILIGHDFVKEVITFARTENITLIVLGKKVKPRWKDLFFRRLADEIARQSQEISVYIVTSKESNHEMLKIKKQKVKIPWRAYGIALAAILLATIVNFFINYYVGSGHEIMIYLLAVVSVALLGKIGPSIFASILSVLGFGLFFVPPQYSRGVADIHYFFTLAVMLIISQIISYLTILTKKQSEAAGFVEHRVSALHTLSRQLANMRGVNKLLEIGVEYIGNFFNSGVIALLPENSQLTVHATYQTEHELDSKEQGVIQWVYDLGQPAGLGTNTLSFFQALYLPLLGSRGSIGVLRISPRNVDELLTPEQMHLLEACANQIALSIEVDQLQQQRIKEELKRTTDQIRSTLLNLVAHDLRTPLISLMGNASTLINLSDQMSSQEIKKTGQEIYFESEQVNRLINNLLRITYLESKEISLQKEHSSLNELIKFIINTSSKKLGKRNVDLQLEERLPKVPFDYTLLQEVIINLLDNAIKFSPKASEIEISTSIKEESILFSIKDKGPGIMPDESDKLFQKYYRGRLLTTERGLGLGLAICRKVIEAHGGKIWAENRIEGGAVIHFILPGGFDDIKDEF
jgi:two-component system sensor histidine kinase KdpD